MKRTIILLFALLVFLPEFMETSTCWAQKKQEKEKAYRVVIDKMKGEGPSRLKGKLIRADSLGITLSYKKSGDMLDEYIPFEQIKKIRYRKKGSLLKGFGIGFLAGATVGAGGVLMFGKDDVQQSYPESYFVVERSKEDKALVIGLTTGVAAGLLAMATVDKTIDLNGDQKTYLNYLPVIYELVQN